MRRRGALLIGLTGLATLLTGRAVQDASEPAGPLPAPTGPLDPYHLGHSLVGRDMPAMLAAMAGHDHALQLGWGASLRDHWTGQVPGMAEENATPAHRPAKAALASGRHAAAIVTEMVELKDALRWHDSARHLALWAALARSARPEARVYLFETWHRLDDLAGWEARILADGPALWRDRLRRPAMRMAGPIHVVPGGPVLAEAVRRAEAGAIPGLTDRRKFFGLGPDGTPDPIHLNDLGAWLMAAAHFAVLYHRRPPVPEGPLLRADGTPATLPATRTLSALQEVVWNTVTRYPATGLSLT